MPRELTGVISVTTSLGPKVVNLLMIRKGTFVGPAGEARAKAAVGWVMDVCLPHGRVR